MGENNVLIVDDEFSINDTLSYTLSKEGFNVKSAYDGETAIKLMEEFKPKVVLLDVMLPDISGFELCRKFSDDTFVIMVTARNDAIDKVLGMEIGADDYITKPFQLREVIARVKAIFRRINKIENISSEDKEKIEIDELNRIVIKNGMRITLKRKEFDLINFLYKNKGTVFTREDLLNKVWGYEYIGDPRTVDVHIRRVRSSLGEEKDNSIIETVFGIGYVMRDDYE